MRNASLALRVLGSLIRQHEHQLILRRRVWPNDDEVAELIGQHLLVLGALAAQLVKRVGFDPAGAAFGGEALQLVVGINAIQSRPLISGAVS
jgi:hypothetical protein